MNWTSLGVIALFCTSLTATSHADCPDGVPAQFTVGAADDFALPFEDVFPRPELAAFITDYLQHPIRACDEPGPDRTVGHTFTGLPDEICAATLELRLRAEIGGSSNDTVGMEFLEDVIPGQGPVWGWGLFISTITGLNWSPGAETTIVLDLAQLLPDPSGHTNVLEHLQDGDLDLVVDDDTTMDYAVLTVWSPGDPTPVRFVSWGSVKHTWRE